MALQFHQRQGFQLLNGSRVSGDCNVPLLIRCTEGMMKQRGRPRERRMVGKEALCLGCWCLLSVAEPVAAPSPALAAQILS